MANKFQIKRTSVTGRAANTSILDIGELALNITDGIMYSTNGTNVFEVGANLTSLSVTGTATLPTINATDVNFVDSQSNNTITASMLTSDTLSFSGDSGQLFSITDSLSGTIFAVNDISGVPSIEVDDDGTIRFAETFGNVLIGTATDDATNKLQVNGSISASNGNSTEWNTAYSWGDHSTQGYLTSFTETDPIFSASVAANITSTDTSNWDTAFGWGDHSTQGYLTSLTDTLDDVTTRGATTNNSITVGSLLVGSLLEIDAETTTLATTTESQIASFAAASYTTAKIIIQAKDSVTGDVQASELLVVHDGTTADVTEYAVIDTGGVFVSYDVDINTGNVRILATPDSSNSTTFKVIKNLITG